MTEAVEGTAIQTEAPTGGMVEAEGNESIGEGKISLADTTPATPEEEKRLGIKEKYSNDINKVIDAYIESQQKVTQLGQAMPKAPEEYEFALAEGVDPEDPLLAEMQNVFKEGNLSNDQANAIVGKFLEYQQANAPSLEAVKQELGGEADSILQGLTDFSRAKLDESERAVFDSLVYDADSARLVNKLVGMTKEQAITTRPAEVDTKSAQDYKDEAFAYKEEHARTISSNKAQQEHYMSLLRKANEVASKA